MVEGKFLKGWDEPEALHPLHVALDVGAQRAEQILWIARRRMPRELESPSPWI